MAKVLDPEEQYRYHMIARSEFNREGPPRSLAALACRLLTRLTPFGIKVNSSPVDGSPYQLRVYLTPAWLSSGVCLHHFFRSDRSVEHHNHPWRTGYALILTEGYVEDRYDPETGRFHIFFRPPWTWNRIRNTARERTWHRILLREREGHELPARPWTLFFHGPRIPEQDGVDAWGFLDARTGRYQGYREVLQQRSPRLESAIDIELDFDTTPPNGTPAVVFAAAESPTHPIPDAVLQEVRAAGLAKGSERT